jgi:arylsulfatase A-like enzyme
MASSSPDNAMDRRSALQRIGGLGLGALLGSIRRSADASSASRPNILFIMTDDHAAHALSCYGSRINQTPNLDRIADEGIRFENAFVTNSLCAPTRATMLTGKYAHKHGKIDNRGRDPFNIDQPIFPRMLRAAGYQTAMLGKWHLRADPEGFDYWNRLPGQGRYFSPTFIEGTDEGRIGQQQYDGYVTDLITDFTIDQLEEYQDTDQPFCIFSWHKAPHRGFQPDDEHDDLYDNYDVPEPETLFDDYEDRASPAEAANMRLFEGPFRFEGNFPSSYSDHEKEQVAYQRFIKDYLGTIASVDDNVGRLLDHLDETGLAGDTLVIYTTDNGFFLGDHGWLDKRFMYEESLRIPLMVRYPGTIPAGIVEDRIALDIDMAETFLDYADVSVPDDMQGRSLRPLLEGRRAPDWRNSMYYHFYENYGPHNVAAHVGVRDHRYKLIHYYRRGNQVTGSNMSAWELFDLEEDPHEMHNVYDDPAYSGVVESMKQELRRLRRRYDDRGPALGGESVEAEEPPAPSEFEVHPSHPNPFHKATTITVDVPEATKIRATVYDVMGRRVETLRSGRAQPGQLRLRWDGTNASGEPVASGVYLCRVEANGAVTTRKVTLAR